MSARRKKRTARGLQLRPGGSTRYRRRVPLDLVPAFGREEIIRGLPGTPDEVEGMLPALNRHLDRGFAAVRKGELSADALIDSINRDYLRSLLETVREGDRRVSGVSPAEHEALLLAADAQVQADLRALLSRNWSSIQWEATRLLAERGRDHTLTNEDFNLLCARLAGSDLAAARAEAARLRGVPLGGDPAPTEIVDPGASSNGKASGITLAEALQAFRLEKVRLGEWVETEAYNRELLEPVWLEALGDIPLCRLDKAAAKRLKDATLATKTAKGEPLAVSTARGYFAKFSTFCSWATAQGWLPANPCSGLSIKMPKHHLKRDERLPLDQADLARLFSPAWRAAVALKPAEFLWVPLIMAYTGMRVREVVQLWTDDVYFDNTGDCYVIRVESGRDRRVKTAESRRVIPVAQALVDLGFIRYAMSYEKSTMLQKLFPLVDVRDTQSQCKAVVNWYSRAWFKNPTGAGIMDPRKSLYSLRHTVTSVLRQEPGVDGAVVSHLLGHAHASMTDSRYASRPLISTLFGVVQLLKLTPS